MKIYESAAALIGATPLVSLSHMGGACRLLAKLEGLNPGGSAKDRVAREMIEAAERDCRRVARSLSRPPAIRA